MSIVVNKLAYTHSDGSMLFDNINFSITKGETVSLIGNNGIGKSTLLQIIVGKLDSSNGTITCGEEPYYILQELSSFSRFKLSEILQVDDKLKALHKILQGDVSVDNFECLGDDWEIEERIKRVLDYWGIGYLNLESTMSALSGGEKVRLLLAGATIRNTGILILDEPTNHLDLESRKLLCQFFKESKKTILLVSHDRKLLNLVDRTIELTPKEAMIYGGNYDFYRQQKMIQLKALEQQLADRMKSYKEVQVQARKLTEQRQKQETRGRSQKEKSGVPRIVLGGLKSKAEVSSARIKGEQQGKLNDLSIQIASVKQQIQEELPLRIELKSPSINVGKLLVKANNINIKYGEFRLWEKSKSLEIYSGDRIHLVGNNGSGKTSLIKLVTKSLKPSEGELIMADTNVLYLDQEYSLLNSELSVYEQAQVFNNHALFEHDIKMLLHYYQLDRAYWDRRVVELSGGEKVKLLLCCLRMKTDLPEFLILDEPTNNLDVKSQEILSYAVKSYKGTLIAISHDITFIKGIAINRTIEL